METAPRPAVGEATEVLEICCPSPLDLAPGEGCKEELASFVHTKIIRSNKIRRYLFINMIRIIISTFVINNIIHMYVRTS